MKEILYLGSTNKGGETTIILVDLGIANATL